MLTFLRISTLVLALVSALTTWSGFRSIGELSTSTFTRDLMPILMAAASYLASVSLWLAMFAWYPKVDAMVRRKLNYAIGIGSVIIFGVSTIWSVMGLGGNAAIVHHMGLTINEAEVVLNKLSAKVQSETGMVSSSNLLAKQFTNLAGKEAGGAFTTYSGMGEVYIQLVSLSETMTNLSQNVSQGIEDRKRAIDEARQEIVLLRQILANPDREVGEKMRDFAKRLGKINQLFQLIGGQEGVQLVREVSRQLDKISATNVPRVNNALAEAQRDAMRRLEETTRSAQGMLRSFAESTDETTPQLHPLTSIDMGYAVLRYFYVILPSWAGAMCLDYVPLLFVFILYWTASTRKQEEEEAYQRTLAEVK